MRVIDTIDIAADPKTVYQVAANISRWSEILPHYRWVKLLGVVPEGTQVEMAAKRGWIPVKWEAVQRCDPSHRRIYYHHIGGATKGMEVVWEIDPAPAGTHITLIHDCTLDTPIVRSWVGTVIVAYGFVHYIAQRTLRTMKTRLEKEQACVEPSLRA